MEIGNYDDYELQQKGREILSKHTMIGQDNLVRLLLDLNKFSYDDVIEGGEDFDEEGNKLTPYEKEYLEFWLVDDYIKTQFLRLGEDILENDYGCWWCRKCSGQEIIIDSVMYQLSKEVLDYERQNQIEFYKNELIRYQTMKCNDGFVEKIRLEKIELYENKLFELNKFNQQYIDELKKEKND